VAAGASVEQLLARLRQIERDADRAVKSAAEAMGAVGEREIKKQLGRTSHAPGTPTQSPPGSPPGLITGQLRRSVRQTKTYSSGAGRWTVHIAPTMIYARIQELGGWAGRGHKSHLPARPYVRPGMLAAELKARDAAIRVFRAFTKT
jgi:phage gpG-like protein